MKISWKKEIGINEKPEARKIVNMILENRHVKDLKEFLFPASPFEISLAAFGFKKELDKTLSLLETIKKRGEMIVVYTDYDADGITGGTILWETFHLLGFKVMPYVPHRRHEGYGFSEKGINRVKKEFNPALIISVDHGISGKKEIAYAAALGINIIVTDHHLAPNELPDRAECVFHIPALSGSGVAYFVAKEIYEHFFQSPITNSQYQITNIQKLKSYFQSDYLALASVGTIADLVPLVGPSRSVVSHGLRAFKETKRKGIKYIIREAGITDKDITPYEVGFIIAPRINAVGRLEHALDALRLLCTHNDKQAEEIASKMGETNRERQDLVASAVKQAKGMIEELIEKEGKPPLIISLLSNDWNEGIIGLIASKISETYSRPTIVMTKSDGFWKWSARSVNDFHMTNFLRSLIQYLISVGGHKGASGFTILDEKKETFLKKVQMTAKKIAVEKDFEKKIEVDLKIPLAFVDIDLAHELERLAPYGIGNPNPLFISEVTVLEKKLFGKKREHVKLFVKDANTGSFPMEFISFFKSDEYREIRKDQTVSLIYNMDINTWNGRESLRGRINYLLNKI